MLDLLDEFARIAFSTTEENYKNPDKPLQPLEALEAAEDLGGVIKDCIDEFCWSLISLERLQNGETTPEKLPHENRELLRNRHTTARKKFCKLFNIGALSITASIGPRAIIIHLQIWNGEAYRPVNEIIEQITDHLANPSRRGR